MVAATDIEDWLVAQGLSGTDEALLVEGFAVRLRDLGVPLTRFMIGSDLLHPTVGGRGYRWELGADVVRQEYARWEVGKESPDWLVSPFRHLIEGGRSEMRRHLDSRHVPDEFPLLDSIKAAGATDYAAFLVNFGPRASIGEADGLALSVATDAPDGFADPHLDLVRRLNPRLGLAYKTISQIDTARTLLRTYLGTDPADRVLAGSIGRGRAEKLRAAIWYSDLEGFTRLADTLPRGKLMPFLNDYAECVVEAIHAHDGQVLKFMGDGILAIFPCADDEDERCVRALDAAIAAQAAFGRLMHWRADKGIPATHTHIGLHLGDVLYGNIGSRDRLDFTVLGPAVNETSRIERMSRSLEQPVIASAAFARALGDERRRLVSLGRYALRGVGRPQELFALDPEQEAEVVAPALAERLAAS
jgi:adenylate cyclase